VGDGDDDDDGDGDGDERRVRMAVALSLSASAFESESVSFDYFACRGVWGMVVESMLCIRCLIVSGEHSNMNMNMTLPNVRQPGMIA